MRTVIYMQKICQHVTVKCLTFTFASVVNKQFIAFLFLSIRRTTYFVKFQTTYISINRVAISLHKQVLKQFEKQILQ